MDREADHFGPAMKALPPAEQAFVISFLELGTGDATEAATAAGLDVDRSHGALKVAAHRIVHKPRVKAAMIEEARRRMTFKIALADRAVTEIVSDAAHTDRLKAALAIYGRAGITEVTERNVNVNINLSVDEKIARIKELAERNGLDLPKLLGTVTEAEFQDLPQPAEEP